MARMLLAEGALIGAVGLRSGLAAGLRAGRRRARAFGADLGAG